MLRLAVPAQLVITSLLVSSPSAAAPPPAAAHAFEQGEFHAALRYIPKDTADPESRLLAGWAELSLGRYKNAVQHLAGLESALPHLQDLCLFLYAQALMGRSSAPSNKAGQARELSSSKAGQARKLAQKAARIFKQVIRLKKSRWVDRARWERARALEKAARYAAAIRAYDLLLRHQPEHAEKPRITLEKAQTYIAWKRRKQAAALLKEIWLRWPAHPEAAVAENLLLRLGTTGVRLIAPPVESLLQRAWQQYRKQRWDDAIATIETAIRRNPAQKIPLMFRIARIQRRAGRFEAAIKTVAPMLDSRNISWRLIARRYTARSLARLGKVEQAAELYKKDIPAAKKRLMPRHRSSLIALGRLYQAYGRFGKALALFDRLAKQIKWSRPLKRRLAWLAYRSGKTDRAVKAITKDLAHRGKPYVLYWTARAYQNAGRVKEAEANYRQIIEKYLRHYYGHMARSRLSEMGLLNIPKQPACRAAGSVAPQNPLPLLKKAVSQFADLLPGLRRVATLWRVGARDEAQREMRLAIVDYAHGAHYRSIRYRIRKRPYRLWNGAPLRWRPLTKRHRKIRKQRREIGPLLGQISRKMDLGYFAWRLAPLHARGTKRRFPRAHRRLVVQTARRFALDPNFLWSIMYTESRYRPDCISVVNAAGLMQMMPYTARRLAGELGWRSFDGESVFDPETNLTLAGQYLRAIWRKFKGQFPLVAASYNGGPHNVAKWLDQRGKQSKLDEFIEEIPFRESRRYAKMIVRLMSIYQRAYCGKDDLLLPNKLETRYLPHPNY
jgi:soluble lytic murein transglycosylase-like protein/tetratricopeptide (TPR) repeat protein